MDHSLQFFELARSLLMARFSLNFRMVDRLLPVGPGDSCKPVETEQSSQQSFEHIRSRAGSA